MLRIAALAPAFLIGIPAQWLALRCGSRLARRFPVLFHRYVCRIIGIRVTVEGRPAAEGAMLMVSNHCSWLDISVVGALAPLSFIARSDVADWPLFGTLARLQRTVFVDRQRRSATGATASQVGGRLEAGETMVLFAEGTTSDGNRVLSFRSALVGAARAALGAADRTVTIQPLTIAYTHRDGLPLGRPGRPFIAWYGDMELMPHLRAILAGGPVDVRVTYGAPLPFTVETDRKAVTRSAERQVRAALRRALTGRPAFSGPDETAMEG